MLILHTCAVVVVSLKDSCSRDLWVRMMGITLLMSVKVTFKKISELNGLHVPNIFKVFCSDS